jgi:hypothetical protein
MTVRQLQRKLQTKASARQGVRLHAESVLIPTLHQRVARARRQT